MSGAAALAGLAAALAAALAVPWLARRGARFGRARELLAPRRARASCGCVATPAARLPVAPADAPRDLEARIAAAGRPAGLGSRELMAAKLAAAVVGRVARRRWRSRRGARPARPRCARRRSGRRLPRAGPLAGPARGASGPPHARELPPLLDLLRSAFESGSSLAQALRGGRRATSGPLAAEWRAVGRQVTLGVPLERALAAMAERAPLPEVAALSPRWSAPAATAPRSADTLAAQARDARFALARHAREEAARAGPKIQLVVALLLVPSVLLLVAAALLAALVGGGGVAGALSS